MRSFSSDNHNSISYSNHGLVEALVTPHLESIRQLPEVDNALNRWNDGEALEEFQRAIQVFETIQAGGDLHVAVVVLLATCFQDQGKYKEAFHAIQTLKQLVPVSNDNSRLLIDFASAKSLWYQGDFSESMNMVNQMMDSEAFADSNFLRGCVHEAEGIVKLMQTLGQRDKDDTTVVQGLKNASQMIEEYSQNNDSAALTSVSANGNLGIATVLTSLALEESNTDSLDKGLAVFSKALDILDNMDTSHATNLLQTHLNCNKAWTSLQNEHELKLASEYSSTALSFAEKLQNQVSQRIYHHALGRSLRLVATCYARADSALTAEGLFQSAIDSLKIASSIDPLACLDLRDALEDYATLLHQWDKRSGDAEKQQEKAQQVNKSLPGEWKDKSSICSGLVFITP
jgi:tetratricopeptide (TPR) repeat protein